MPVKLSDELVKVARREAAAAERSITAQIEHWAKLGRSVEAALRHEDALTVKESGGDLRVGFGNPTTSESVYQVLRAITGVTDRSELARTLRRGRTVYENDLMDSGAVARIAPDGTRTRGRFEKRTFVPTGGNRRRARG